MKTPLHRTVAVIALIAMIAVWFGSSTRRPQASAEESKPDGIGPVDPRPALRRPMALALLEDSQLLITANRGSGTLSVVHLEEEKPASEFRLGEAISDVVPVPGTSCLLAIDEATHELHLVARDEQNRLRSTARCSLSKHPVSLRVSRDGKRCFVASLWSRRISLFDVDVAAEQTPFKQQKIVDLPFAPREQLLVKDDSLLIVADAFGGKLAILDAVTGELKQVRDVPAHNIRGLALTPDGNKVLLSHQILNDLAETTQNDVHWGVLMSNVLRWVVLDHLLDPATPVLKDSHVHLAGDISSAGGDPNRLVVSSKGQAVVALGGVDEVGFGVEEDYSLTRLPIGRRPTAVAVTADGATAYVANGFDDSISVVNLRAGKVARTISLGDQPELSAAQRGERLFYDARLSLDGWFSCHSCHTDGHTNGQRSDNLGDGSFGAAKQVLSLLGVADTRPWAWKGDVESLERQIDKSIHTTMQGDAPNKEAVADIAAYLKTLEPPPSLAAARGDADVELASQGRDVFVRSNCLTCHSEPAFTSEGTFDVGLHDKAGNLAFNPPSLRGVSQRDAFFHDGRAASLREVFVKHRHQVDAGLSEFDLANLLEFLRGL